MAIQLPLTPPPQNIVEIPPTRSFIENPTVIYATLKPHQHFYFLAIHLQNDSLDGLRQALHCGLDINAKNFQGKTLLHLAMCHGNFKFVEFLLKNPLLDVHHRSFQPTNVTPIEDGILFGNWACVKLLLYQGKFTHKEMEDIRGIMSRCKELQCLMEQKVRGTLSLAVPQYDISLIISPLLVFILFPQYRYRQDRITPQYPEMIDMTNKKCSMKIFIFMSSNKT